mmetsp:Transcript_32880/g.97667  ORF Transcript_32880/g.97667 Transcript_32880/m.97667 type:complete len:408 (-) Transcript_32880:97-1320(-)
MTAAAQRKLQKDIDVVLKKVDDGIEEFAQVFEQATTTSAGAQREKLGEELKKSINKLQRLRAQIREWIAQTDIKNNSKDKLEDARKRIENDMQRFKDFERDLKTKAFSTSGLSKGDDLELEELEKMKYQDWLTTMIQSLNDQTDELDAEIETLDKKKSLSADEKSRQQQLKAIQERHRWHINKLEQLLRALDNDTIEMSDLAVVRDSLEMYIDAGAHDSENFHDEALYDCFDLTEFEEKQVKARTPSMDVPKTPVAADTPTASSKEAATPTAEPAKKNKEKDKKKKEVTVEQLQVMVAKLVEETMVTRETMRKDFTLLEGNFVARELDPLLEQFKADPENPTDSLLRAVFETTLGLLEKGTSLMTQLRMNKIMINEVKKRIERLITLETAADLLEVAEWVSTLLKTM